MIILHTKGQTGNKFFTYLPYLGDSLETGEKLVILSPDITFKHYPNLMKTEKMKFPFYFKFLSKLIGYENYINLLYFLFGNKYVANIFKVVFKVIPGVRFIMASPTTNKSRNHSKYFIEIKNIFTPNMQIIKSVETIFNELRSSDQVICGVHIRYGDYRTWQGGKYFFTEKQYHSKMLEVKEAFKNKNVFFFISSNEKIDLSVFTGCDCFTIPNSSATKDMFGLSLTNYIIGPPSTFSGWASYYGNTPLYFIEDPADKIEKSSFSHIFDIWN